MKTTLLLILVLFSQMTYAGPLGFSEVDKKSSEFQFFFEAREAAAKYIREAAPKLSPYAQEMGEKIIQSLRFSKFFVATSPIATSYCKKSDFFVEPRTPNTIFICESALNKIKNGKRENMIMEIGQLFIHEGGHIAGYRDECDPTEFELAIMYDSVGIQTFANRDEYKPRCGNRFDAFYNLASNKRNGPKNISSVSSSVSSSSSRAAK